MASKQENFPCFRCFFCLFHRICKNLRKKNYNLTGAFFPLNTEQRLGTAQANNNSSSAFSLISRLCSANSQDSLGGRFSIRKKLSETLFSSARKTPPQHTLSSSLIELAAPPSVTSSASAAPETANPLLDRFTAKKYNDKYSSHESLRLFRGFAVKWFKTV